MFCNAEKRREDMFKERQKDEYLIQSELLKSFNASWCCSIKMFIARDVE